jgi:hypothetical protein
MFFWQKRINFSKTVLRYKNGLISLSLPSKFLPGSAKLFSDSRNAQEYQEPC